MSRRSVPESPVVARWQELIGCFTTVCPHLAPYFGKRSSDFRGLSAFIGEAGDTVVGFRIFSDDGSPQVCWSSGEDLFFALLNLDRAVGGGRFRPDKKAIR